MESKSGIRLLALLILLILPGFGPIICHSAEIERGNILRIVKVDVDPQNEGEFNRWFNEEHEPLLKKIPGVLAIYRGKNLGQIGQKYFSLYVHKNMDVQKSTIYREPGMTKWAKEVGSFLKNVEARNYEVIVPNPLPENLRTGNIIRTVEINVAPEQEQDFNDFYGKEHIPALNKVQGVMTIWRAVNLGEKGQKHIAVYFQESMAVQQSEDYKKAAQTDWLKKLSPFLKDIVGSNYEILIQ